MTKSDAVTYGAILNNAVNPYDKDEALKYVLMENAIQDLAIAKSNSNSHINIKVFTAAGVREAFSADL